MFISSSFPINIPNHSPIQLMLKFLKAPLLVQHISDLPEDVISNVTISAVDTTLYSKCDQDCDLWRQIELVSELESDLGDTADWGRKWLVDFNAVKTEFISFDQSNKTGAIDVKMDDSWEKIF